MLKVVLDTNVFVSSLLVKAGPPAQVLAAWRARSYLLIVSPALVGEVRATLEYPRIRRKYAITAEDVQELVDLFGHDALLVPGDDEATLRAVQGAVPDDPDDETILACALESGADLIVSGDRHLLGLGTFRGVPVLSVREFLERLDKEQ